jgi:hypothetical protein
MPNGLSLPLAFGWAKSPARINQFAHGDVGDFAHAVKPRRPTV